VPALIALGQQGTSERVKAQEPRPAGPARGFARGSNGRRNGRWVHPIRKRTGDLLEGERFEGRNPKIAVGMKHGRPGLGGSKPPRGFRNPEGGT
jgi:hypothetical protein